MAIATSQSKTIFAGSPCQVQRLAAIVNGIAAAVEAVAVFAVPYYYYYRWVHLARRTPIR